jgi:hypothetical protein
MKVTADQREYICHLDKDQQVELYTLLAKASNDLQRYYVINEYRRKHPITKAQIARLLAQRGISARDVMEFSLPLDGKTAGSSSIAPDATTSEDSANSQDA